MIFTFLPFYILLVTQATKASREPYTVMNMSNVEEPPLLISAFGIGIRPSIVAAIPSHLFLPGRREGPGDTKICSNERDRDLE